MMHKSKLKRWMAQSPGDKIFDIFNFIILFLATMVCLYPLYYVVIVSFSKDAFGTYLIPNGFTLAGYKAVLQSSEIWIAYLNTIFYAVGGVVFGLTLTLPCAYSLSRRDLIGRKAVTLYLLVTMFVSGGTIPTYLVVQKLHLVNTRAAIIIMTGCGVYNIVVARTFFSSNIPDELLEAARMDGCSYGRFFMKIALPLSKPICAVLALWIGVGRWNSYFTELMYLRDANKQPLAMYLRRVLWKVELLVEVMDKAITADAVSYYQEQSRLASIMQYVIIVCVTAPMMLLYPFIQKYFAKGVMIGSVKG